MLLETHLFFFYRMSTNDELPVETLCLLFPLLLPFLCLALCPRGCPVWTAWMRLLLGFWLGSVGTEVGRRWRVGGEGALFLQGCLGLAASLSSLLQPRVGEAPCSRLLGCGATPWGFLHSSQTFVSSPFIKLCRGSQPECAVCFGSLSGDIAVICSEFPV